MKWTKTTVDKQNMIFDSDPDKLKNIANDIEKTMTKLLNSDK